MTIEMLEILKSILGVLEGIQTSLSILVFMVGIQIGLTLLRGRG